MVGCERFLNLETALQKKCSNFQFMLDLLSKREQIKRTNRRPPSRFRRFNLVGNIAGNMPVVGDYIAWILTARMRVGEAILACGRGAVTSPLESGDAILNHGKLRGA